MNLPADIPQLTERTLALLGRSGAPLVVACSGGADSLLLALLARQSGTSARIVHVHHGLTQAADQGERITREFAHAQGLELEVVRVDGEALRNDPRGIEAAARAARYAAFARSLRPGERVVTGHTATDRLATLLMRLVQGAGLGALRGPREEAEILGVPVLRPMLHWWRSAVEQALAERGIEYWEDPENHSPRYLRNQVEALVVEPLLQLGDPTVLERSLDTVAREVEAFEAWRLQQLGDLVREAPDGSRLVSAARFREFDEPARHSLMITLLRDMGVRGSAALVERFSDAVVRQVHATGRGVRLESSKGVSRILAVPNSRLPLPPLPES